MILVQADEKQRLEALRKRIDEARQERARAEATLEHARKQRDEALAKLAELGVSEEQIQAEIDRLAAEITFTLDEAEQLLNQPLAVPANPESGGDPF